WTAPGPDAQDPGDRRLMIDSASNPSGVAVAVQAAAFNLEPQSALWRGLWWAIIGRTPAQKPSRQRQPITRISFGPPPFSFVLWPREKLDDARRNAAKPFKDYRFKNTLSKEYSPKLYDSCEILLQPTEIWKQKIDWPLQVSKVARAFILPFLVVAAFDLCEP